jgi:hypothetical protein
VGLRLNPFTSKNPGYFEKNQYKPSSRLMDELITTDKLVYNNFSKKEVMTILSDPAYFHLNDKKFLDVDFFKNIKLIDRIKQEDKNLLNHYQYQMKSSIIMSESK